MQGVVLAFQLNEDLCTAMHAVSWKRQEKNREGATSYHAAHSTGYGMAWQQEEQT
jgi:hypothetical protein